MLMVLHKNLTIEETRGNFFFDEFNVFRIMSITEGTEFHIVI